MDSERATISVTEEDSLWDLIERHDLARVFEEAQRHPGGPGPGPVRAAPVSLFEAASAAAVSRRLTTGTLTVDVLGSAPGVWWQAGVLCRSLPEITHLAVTADVAALPGRLADQLLLAGIDVTPTTGPFGASLVVATELSAVNTDSLRAGALLVEAAPAAFAPEVHRRAGSGSFTLVPAPPPDPALTTAFAVELEAARSR